MRQDKNETEMAMNRTGISKAPGEARKTAAGARQQATRGSEKQLVAMRSAIIRESRGVGSLPEPAKRQGGRRTAGKVRGLRLLLDKMGERAAFERSGVRLYEAMINKVEALGAKEGPPPADLRHIRDEELEHFRLVAEHLEKLGGDRTAETPCADVSGVASRGIMQVLTDPRTTVSQGLSALLTAELTDNAGWELLIELCEGLGEAKTAQAFRKAYQQETEHLAKIRLWISEDLERQMG